MGNRFCGATGLWATCCTTLDDLKYVWDWTTMAWKLLPATCPPGPDRLPPGSEATVDAACARDGAARAGDDRRTAPALLVETTREMAGSLGLGRPSHRYPDPITTLSTSCHNCPVPAHSGYG